MKHIELGYIKNMKFGVDKEDRFVFPYGPWKFYVNIADEFGAATDIFIAEFDVSENEVVEISSGANYSI